MVISPLLWPQHHSGIFRKGVLGAEPLGEPEGVLPGVVRGVAPGVRMSSLRACVSSLLSALSGTRPCTTQHLLPSLLSQHCFLSIHTWGTVAPQERQDPLYRPGQLRCSLIKKPCQSRGKALNTGAEELQAEASALCKACRRC